MLWSWQPLLGSHTLAPCFVYSVVRTVLVQGQDHGVTTQKVNFKKLSGWWMIILSIFYDDGDGDDDDDDVKILFCLCTLSGAGDNGRQWIRGRVAAWEPEGSQFDPGSPRVGV